MAVQEGPKPPDDPHDMLPEDSVLSLEEYLDMHAAVGQPVRYEILYRLVHGDSMSPTELKEEIDVGESNLHYHLDQLVDVGLIEKRARTERDEEGMHVYYRPTVFGRVTLTEGVDELIRGEQEFDTMYAEE